MPMQLTVTSRTGPGSTVTAQVLPNIANLALDFNKKVATVTMQDGTGPREFDINGTTTLTCTIAAGANGTMVISQ